MTDKLKALKDLEDFEWSNILNSFKIPIEGILEKNKLNEFMSFAQDSFKILLLIKVRQSKINNMSL